MEERNSNEGHYPLDGIVVIDLSQIYNGPYATYLMALAGATVIKVEPPTGEALRRRTEVGGAALPFAMLNGWKQSVVLDLKTQDGAEALKALVSDADVIVENFAPGVMERLGLGAATLQAINPRLVYASSSGFGKTGPFAKFPAMDLTIQAMSGAMHVTGFPDRPPVKTGPAIADFFAGIHLYGAILTALYEREHTGVARVAEVSMQDAIFASLSSNIGMHWLTGGRGDVVRTGNRHGGLAECPYNVYATRDGHIAMICNGDAHWRALAVAMGRDELGDDPRYARLKERVSRMDEVDALVEAWTSSMDTDGLFHLLMEARIPCAPVRTLEQVLEDENMLARGALQRVDHPELGPIMIQQSPMRYEGVPLRPFQPSERLGASTGAILKECKALAPDVADRLARAGTSPLP